MLVKPLQQNTYQQINQQKQYDDSFFPNLHPHSPLNIVKKARSEINNKKLTPKLTQKGKTLRPNPRRVQSAKNAIKINCQNQFNQSQNQNSQNQSNSNWPEFYDKCYSQSFKEQNSINILKNQANLDSQEIPKEKQKYQNNKNNTNVQQENQYLNRNLSSHKYQKLRPITAITTFNNARTGYISPYEYNQSNNNNINSEETSQYSIIKNSNKQHYELTKKELQLQKKKLDENFERKKKMAQNKSNLFKINDILLGEGTYGQVYQGLVKDTGKFIAVKQINIAEFPGVEEDITSEIQMLQNLQHPNIVRYLGSKIEKDNLFIYLEQMTSGSLMGMLKEYGKFQENIIKKYTQQLLQGLNYLHSYGVVHRDLKCANILCDSAGNIKLTDFGSAQYLNKFIRPGKEFGVNNDSQMQIASNYSFMSKNQTQNNNNANQNLDSSLDKILEEQKEEKEQKNFNNMKGSLYWMARCCIIEMATGEHPWKECRSVSELICLIFSQKLPEIPNELSENCKDFIKKCLTFEKDLRPRISDLLEHPFVQE
ncbi:Protein kinase-like domain [Pseudocohnilembus persalinus]|uniref:Protein kinase-like domain n=1 Tax=Pseudocohnilembus persalinus TaxID=266149 RepID=A0A0V0QHF2_PSEPJ|nr:Protein kinase-like domain [Pseudocohnilembus persalinus]|eukprot:KRX01493.1 Protein kinase-like domain [Pseudocohnilembus persalinus]